MTASSVPPRGMQFHVHFALALCVAVFGVHTARPSPSVFYAPANSKWCTQQQLPTESRREYPEFEENGADESTRRFSAGDIFGGRVIASYHAVAAAAAAAGNRAPSLEHSARADTSLR